jgi:hypothetical protein
MKSSSSVDDHLFIALNPDFAFENPPEGLANEISKRFSYICQGNPKFFPALFCAGNIVVE